MRLLRVWWPTALFALMVVAAYFLSPDPGSVLESVVNVVVYGAFSLTGGWIVLRSGNRMGRLFQALALASVSLFLSDSYLAMSLAGAPAGSLENPFDLAVLAVNVLMFVPFFLLSFVLPFFLFPTGRPSSPRWSYVVRGIVGWAALVSMAALVAPVFEVDDELGGEIRNPWAIDALAGPASFLTDHVFTVISLLGLIAVASLVFRYRAAGAEQRAQIRWFLLAGVFLIFAVILDEVILDALAVDVPVLENSIELVAKLVGLLGLPVATAIAILKYRLYEVDVVINKTLVYGSVTLMLALLYAGVVLGMQRALPAVTGDSDLAVAAATLAAAGAFRPLRSRLQSFIDQRFYRRKYDASETLQGFSTHLRDQVDLAELTRQLVGVIGSTMQPAHASLWLRDRGRVR